MRLLIDPTTAHDGSLLAVVLRPALWGSCSVPYQDAAAICATVLQDRQEESGSLADMLKAGLKKAPEDDQLAFGGPRYQATDPSSQVGEAVIRLSMCRPCYQTTCASIQVSEA